MTKSVLADLVIFSEEILNGKHYFLCSDPANLEFPKEAESDESTSFMFHGYSYHVEWTKLTLRIMENYI